MSIRHFWAVLNSLLVALGLSGGYVSLTPDTLRNTNPGPVLCLIILLITPLFVISTVAYSIRRWKSAPLARPSWSRNPLRWWRDPLQALFISTCIIAAIATGSALRGPAFGSVGFWTLGVYACFAIGLFAGQMVVYRVYRQIIASS